MKFTTALRRQVDATAWAFDLLAQNLAQRDIIRDLEAEVEDLHDRLLAAEETLHG